MPIDPLPNDLEVLRVLVSQLSSERDAAIEETRRLIEQNDNLRYLLKKLQNAQFGKKSNDWIMTNCSWRWKISRPPSPRRMPRRRKSKPRKRRPSPGPILRRSGGPIADRC